MKLYKIFIEWQEIESIGIKIFELDVKETLKCYIEDNKQYKKIDLDKITNYSPLTDALTILTLEKSKIAEYIQILKMVVIKNINNKIDNYIKKSELIKKYEFSEQLIRLKMRDNL